MLQVATNKLEKMLGKVMAKFDIQHTSWNADTNHKKISQKDSCSLHQELNLDLLKHKAAVLPIQ